MNWNKGYSARYFGTIVDPISWRDTTTFDFAGGNISNTSTGLRVSADLDNVTGDFSKERWVRVYLDCRQNGQSTRTPMFTGLATSPDINYDGKLREVPLACYSVLKPCEDVLLDRGWYAPNGADGANLIKQLLATSTPAPVTVEGISPKLSQYIIAEDGESHLSMADKVLKAIGWRLRITGDGTIHICPRATAPSASYDTLENDSIEPQVSLKNDWYSCPNVFRAVSGDFFAIARDDSMDSLLSTVNRGREVWGEETSCKLNSAESLAGYATRRLKELQMSTLEVDYTRRYNPNLLVTDIVKLNYPVQNVVGLYRVTQQKIELTHGGRTSETVEAV